MQIIPVCGFSPNVCLMCCSERQLRCLSKCMYVSRVGQNVHCHVCQPWLSKGMSEGLAVIFKWLIQCMLGCGSSKFCFFVCQLWLLPLNVGCGFSQCMSAKFTYLHVMYAYSQLANSMYVSCGFSKCMPSCNVYCCWFSKCMVVSVYVSCGFSHWMYVYVGCGFSQCMSAMFTYLPVMYADSQLAISMYVSCGFSKCMPAFL